MTPFSINRSLEFGWDIFKKNKGLLIGLMFLMGIISIILEILPRNLNKQLFGIYDDFVAVSPLSLIVNIILKAIIVYIGILLTVGLIKIALKLHDKQNVQVSDLYKYTQHVWKYFLGSIVLFVYVAIPVIAAAVIGIILLLVGAPSFFSAIESGADENIALGLWASAFAILATLIFVAGLVQAARMYFKYLFWNYALVDKSLGPIESLKHSAKITQGHRYDLLGLFCVLILINLLGALVLFIGLFITIPVTWLATVYIYRRLDSGHETEQPQEIIDAEPEPVIAPKDSQVTI